MDPWNPRSGISEVSSLFDMEAPQVNDIPSSRAEFLRLQDQVTQLQNQLAQSRMQSLMDHNQGSVGNAQSTTMEDLVQGVNVMNIEKDRPPHQQVPMNYEPQNPQQLHQYPSERNHRNLREVPVSHPPPLQFVQSHFQPPHFNQPMFPQSQNFPPHFASHPHSQFNQESIRFAPPPHVNFQNQQHFPSQYPPHQFSPVTQYANVPPHPSQRAPFQPPSAVSVMSQAIPPPRFRQNIRFSGTAAHLKSFFQDFYQEIRENEAYFSLKDDKFKINWLSTLFEPRSTASYWFQSLLEQNAAGFGKFDGFDDLKGLDYHLPALSSFPLFLQELRTNFSDKNEDRTNRKNLDNCRQGNHTIVDYNSRFRSLVIHVSISPEDAILKYVKGLDPDVLSEAVRLQGWIGSKVLQEKMNLAVQASEIVQELSELPSNHPSYIKKHHKPDSQYIHQYRPTQVQVHRPDQATPMDIDAVNLGSTKKNSIFFQIMNACKERKICAKCLKHYDVNGSHANRVCPNQNKTLQEKLKFLDIKPISQVAIENSLEDLTHDQPEEININSVAFVTSSPEQILATNDLLGDYFSAMNEIIYPEELQQEVHFDISSIRIDTSQAADGKFIVPFTLSNDGSPVAIMALIDTGAMADLIDQGFVAKHGIKTVSREPMRCFGFDGSAGSSGVVDKEWCGFLTATSNSSSAVKLPAKLGVTAMHGQDVILGLPWMKSVGASAICHRRGVYLAIDGVVVAAMSSSLSVVS